MPGNNNPIFTRMPDVQWAVAAVSAANTAKDGTGTVNVIYDEATASPVPGGNGCFVQKVVIRSRGTNVATVLRVFTNNGGSNATPANNCLIAEMTLPATTLSEVAAQPSYELPLNIGMSAGARLFVTLGTAVAAGYSVSAWGGKY